MRRYWIEISIALYFISAGLSIFFFKGEEWRYYFWDITLISGCLNLSYNFKVGKTLSQMMFILVDFIFKVFVLLYALIGQYLARGAKSLPEAYKKEEWMSQNIFFLCNLSFCIIIALSVWRLKYYGKIK